ncbi:protein-disulfide reductase DsbD family protein [Abyssalbus ytuae]|uniref:Thioredoxin family protein n=1 Tax=Abyssalbus ytuae TaxID=2926907 RepID=A0A9E6ZL23_9FLAO|nr:cytochrome c biogenesis protein CcdA [Abyssalbus ytuae]UOB17729.1 thioredoxin family protein [Abyssalbus ytuae]
MKKLTLILTLITGFIMNAQNFQEPVTWNYSVEKINSTEYNLIFSAAIEDQWHVYSQFTPDGGALPTEITFNNVNEDFELVGEAKEGKTYREYSEVFEVDEVFFKNELLITQRIKLLKENIKSIQGNIFYQACIDVCINRDEDFIFSLDGTKVAVAQKTVDEKSQQISQNLKLSIKNPEKIVDVTNKGDKEKGLLSIFILGFLGGLIALLTPCVFPMIPLTVSFFTKHTKDKKKGITNAIIYGLFIIGIYLLLSIPFHFLDSLNPEILNNISTNVWLNVIFFVIFIFFAFSFFGYYELTLPSSWGNKMDSASNVGGMLGIFFMALTLAIVSFSCTGPILGSLLAGSLSADGGAYQLTAGMTGFGTALALPFALFALFPNWLNSLPKSGGWMNTVKVVLGFLELALAFKFLSNADLVQHWGLLKREIFIALWIVIFVLMALYIFNIIKFPHDGPKKKLGFTRITFGILVIAFIIYLIPGLQKTESSNLKLLSGFPPPLFYSIYEQETECPLGLTCFKDFDEGIAYAEENNKPVLLDFTGWACVNCRKMEENVWSENRVYSLLKDNYVLISLYVDDRKNLPDEKQFNYQFDSGRVKTIETVGDKWATFQALNFKSASQPYYVLMSPDLKLLNTPQQYTDADVYYNWLKQGLENYR